jgi:hypothetical protein
MAHEAGHFLGALNAGDKYDAKPNFQPSNLPILMLFNEEIFSENGYR